MRFAARESAMFSQMELAFGLIPGGGATQHLARLMGRARALEVMLSAEDYDADLGERYGWINRALPPTRSTISSDRSLIGSPGFRPPAVSRSRTGSMRSRSHRPRSSVAIPISSARPCRSQCRRQAETRRHASIHGPMAGSSSSPSKTEAPTPEHGPHSSGTTRSSGWPWRARSQFARSSARC
jgi:enoyl-CoA hydratase/carnithine racemase